MKKNLSKKFSIPAALLLVVLVVGIVVGNLYALSYAPILTTYFGHTSYRLVEDKDSASEDTQYFKREFTTEEERLAADSKAGQEAAAEGIVLLTNKEKTLPLESAQKISLFGVGSVDILYGGIGSGTVDASKAPTLRQSLEAAGFEINPVLWDFYTTGAAKDIRMQQPDIAGNGRYIIHEAAPSLFTKTQEDSFEEYGDVAVVTFSRSGGESSDLPTVYDQSYGETASGEGYFGAWSSAPVSSPEDVGRSYLELTKNEEDLLKYVSEKFDKVIVVINASNQMELGFLEDTSLDIDGALWIGNPGQDGLLALGQILNGTVNPSGRLVNTYAYDGLSAPATVNFGSNAIEGGEALAQFRGSHFVVYQEGIYVGYKYYETRYEDAILDQGNAKANVGVTSGGNEWNYDDEVQFPFGYGLSYSEFELSLEDAQQNDDHFAFKVKVTNTGDRAGKEVVQLYMQSPYTDYDRQAGIEKSALSLVGFAKTDEIEPGQSQEVTILVSDEELKTYDATANNGQGTYIIEAGKYLFTAAQDAHQAIQQILVDKGAKEVEASQGLVANFDVKASDKYAVSQETGNPIVNQFTDVDAKTYDENFTYLTRSDWEATYPQPYQLVLNDVIEAGVAINQSGDIEGAQMPVTGQNNGLTLAMVKDLPLDDPLWEELFDQLTAEEMYNLVRIGGYQTQQVSSVGAPATVHVDGPAYVGVAGMTGVTTAEETYAWSSEILLGSTWNTQILNRMGQLIGEDALAQGELNFAGWYAPAMNIHRTAYSGRNFEYYSEDPFLSAEMGQAATAGATSKGLITFIKHFALNDQETNRAGLVTLANEQAIREIYLSAFEDAVTQGGALGIMAGMNRVGLEWAGSHTGLMTNVVRDEWNFPGIIVTDQASFPQAFPFMTIRGALNAGTDLFLNTGVDNWIIDDYQNNPTVMSQLRQASERILYATSQSLAMNGIASSTSVQAAMPLWQTWLIIFDVVMAVLIAGAGYLLLKKTNWKKAA